MSSEPEKGLIEATRQKVRAKVRTLQQENKRLRDKLELRDLEIDLLQVEARDLKTKHAKKVRELRQR